MNNFLAITGALIVVCSTAACSKSVDTSSAPRTAAALAIGRRIEFKQGGDSEQYRVSGWSGTEEKFTWTEGSFAKLALPIGSDKGPWVLKATVAALIKPPDLSTQPVEVYANDKKIADWDVGNTAEFTASIPAVANANGGSLAIEFRIPKATSPKSLGLNEDARTLGICVFAIAINKT